MKRRYLFLSVLIVLAALFSGCTGEPVGDEKPVTTPEEQNGGTSDIQTTQAGKNSVVTAQAPIAAGEHGCENGGISVDAGIDTNGNGKLDSAEVSSTQYVCHGSDGLGSLISVDPEPSGSADCPDGGLRVETGRDTNANGVLDDSEVTSTNYVCNGANGSPGGEPSPSWIWSLLTLPDTGQTTSYTDIFGEDSDYTINPPSYTDNGDGTITDNVTNLVWQKEDDDVGRSWTEAVGYCDALSLGGHTDWRLPSDIELMSIVDYGTFSPAINTTYFPNTNFPPASYSGNNANYWSSSTFADITFNTWSVDFRSGSIRWDIYKAYWNYVRCVRGGQ